MFLSTSNPQTVMCYPFFGRLVGTTFSVGKDTPRNQCTEWIQLPCISSGVSNGSTGCVHYKSVCCELLSYGLNFGTPSTVTPYVAGWVIENYAAGAAQLDFDARMSIQKDHSAIPVHTTSR